MSTLHTLNKSPANQTLFEQMLSVTEPGDALLLLEDGVYYCLQATFNRRIQDIPVYALKDDLNARGLPYEHSDVIPATYEEFVDLCASNDKVLNWY